MGRDGRHLPSHETDCMQARHQRRATENATVLSWGRKALAMGPTVRVASTGATGPQTVPAGRAIDSRSFRHWHFVAILRKSNAELLFFRQHVSAGAFGVARQN
jgi:hypothetical protein